ncbi:MFS transporter [Rhodococcus koreensis]|uniref:MFS transporter n=1 Tax=Rhodococcus koreensis TaxID=99653 RepID=UPI00366D484C
MNNISAVDARRRALLAGAIGNFMEWYDFALYAFFATTIASLFFPKGDPAAALLYTFAIFGASFVARPLGAIFFGHLGDRMGRRFALLVSVILMSVGTAGMGLLPNYAQIGTLAPVLLLTCRLVQGFSAGGEFAGSTILVIEHTPFNRRGRYASYATISYVVGSACAAGAAMIATSAMTPDQLESWGWRVPFLVAGPLALLALYLRLRVEESPVFNKLRSEGKTETSPLKTALKTAKRPMLVMIGWCAANGVAYYLLSAFLVSHLTKTANFTAGAALAMQLLAQVVIGVGVLFAGRAIDRIGRKQVAVFSAACLGLWAIPSFVLFEHSTMLVACLVTVAFALFYSGITTTNTLAIAELFPPNVRTSGAAFSYQLSFSLFGGSAPYLATLVTDRGFELFPGVYLAALCAVSTAVAAVGIGNRPKSDRPSDLTDEGTTQMTVDDFMVK